MKHVVFAEFQDRDAATAALHDLQVEGVRGSRCNIDVHAAHADQGDRPIAESDTRANTLFGVVLGLMGGAVMGWLVAGPLHAFEIGIAPAMICGALFGMVIGFIGGALTGAMNPDKKLHKMESHAEKRGGVVATVEVEGLQEEESIKRVFSRHGAAAVEKRMI